MNERRGIRGHSPRPKQPRWISVSETVKKCDVAGLTDGGTDVLR